MIISEIIKKKYIMKQFRLVDNILGWAAFLVAAVVYCSTVEPTASFWDCPEFILAGYKLEIGHPPGAPFFMLTANIFSQFASDPTQVAYMVNIMSALLSATCILFLFWSITHLTRKLILKDWADLSIGKLIAIEASGLVGALIYTFSDTFWYSAVEGEVYAYSSAFTAVVFWLILKWEDNADKPHSDRWLVLIMYMTGLSIGVHLLNLLCVPAIVLVYYYRKFPNADLKGSLLALLVSFVIVAVILYGLVPGIVTVGGWFELLFVNQLGMPFNTGLIVYIFMLVCIVAWAIYESYTNKSRKRCNASFVASVAMLGIPFYGHGFMSWMIGLVVLAALCFVLKIKKDKKFIVTARAMNTTLLCLLMLMIGYSTYAITVIRSSANTPMDQNSPEDIFTLGSYLSREQYGDRPLLYGQAYTSQVKYVEDGQYCRPKMKEGAPVYQQKEKASKDEKDSYFIVQYKRSYEYAQNMLFPRMHSSDHAASYESWMGGVKGREELYNRCGEVVPVKMPTQLENIQFFLSYQCNFMYWRYFMWNFAGRQNDVQGHGELEHGNWITGIPFFDNWRLGDQSKLPELLKTNKGHNVFYCLPLLLGLIGLFWQAYRGQRGIRQFWVVFFLFFMTGLAIVVYLNQTPGQPRERDYAYAGSFYAFAIWCGMGVAAIIDLIKKGVRGVMAKKDKSFALSKNAETGIALAVAIAAIFVPVQMASQTWDDHDRSGRYVCRDFGQNYLMSLPDQGNPIIYTNGDNDTFPLWYNQEVEGVRTDVRVCNLSYLQTDWYIDQMRRPAYDSPSVPITWPRLDYCSGTNDYIEVRPEMKQLVLEQYANNPEAAKAEFGDEPFELKNIIKYWIRNKDKNLHYIPTDTLYITIDKEAVKKSGMMMASDSIPDKMVISLGGKSILYKGDMMILEMLAQCNWTRPIYVAYTVGPDNYMNLDENCIQEGLVKRFSPFTTTLPGAKGFDSDKTYDNMMNRYKYGNISQEGIYLDETAMRMCYTHRRLFGQLVLNLLTEGKEDMAKKALAYAEKAIPAYNVPLTFVSGAADLARGYAALGDQANAKRILSAVFKNECDYMNWYNSLSPSRFAMSQQDCWEKIYYIDSCVRIAESIGDAAYYDNMLREYSRIMEVYMAKGGQMPEYR